MTFEIYPTIDERVTAGATYLDEVVPDWLGRIDVDTLDIASCSTCILGQLFGGSLDGRLRLELDLEFARDLGFYNYPDIWEYGDLTEAWKTLITDRRAED